MALKQGHDTCPIKTVAAGEVGQLVLDQIQAILASPEMVVKIWQSALDTISRENCET
uniref:Resolvase, N-terminal domain n=1 Tax=Magnetococcus massalia (strain MO-1) TaxID=451514 RepID=A0A1S7LJW8_MAGMO